MHQPHLRAVFDGLISKTHVAHALIQPGDCHNDIPTALATVTLLDGTPTQLQEVYEHKKRRLQSWPLSPGRISNLDDRTKHLGDDQYQRAYMDYFSMENGKLGGNATVLALSHLISRPDPLIYGLFGGYGRSLLFLSDGIELQNAVVVVESLVLAAVDWCPSFEEILALPQVAMDPDELLPPETILARIAYDGRFSGTIKEGPGFREMPQILSNKTTRAAVIDYVHMLDIRDQGKLVRQLSHLSVLLLCATHKKGKPAFDFYLGSVPTFVNCLRVLLYSFQGSGNSSTLIRGVWTLIVLAYITQLRPVIDHSLLSFEAPENGVTWDGILRNSGCQANSTDEKHPDCQLLRTLRSMRELGQASGGQERVYVQAAWKLRSQWKKWAGLGSGNREETLNIRL